MNQNTIVSAVLIGVIGFSGYMLYKKITSKRLGDTCEFAEGGANGFIVETAEREDLEKGIFKTRKKCRRCNKTGCASYDVK